MYTVGIDVGGTHTDLVLLDTKTGEIQVHKTPTTVEDPSKGAVLTLDEHIKKQGISPKDISYLMHGTTIATNIALEHGGAKTGLITTEGFRDILHMARHKRPQTFSLQLDLPWQKFPLVPRRWRHTVPERMVPPGVVLIPLDEDAVKLAVASLIAEGIEAIAICFLHSYLNSKHEAKAKKIIKKMAPDIFVTTSHEVTPQYREYERFSTTALNAYVGPKTSKYLGTMSESLRQSGVEADLHLMQSSGGATTLQSAQLNPVNLLMSGPVGGLMGGIFVGKSAGFSNVITLDVGGTSADIGVAPNGEVLYKHILDTRLGDYHAMVPMAEIDAIGAGGGSIAYVDSGGQFQVGPRSAGANPGPASYNKGGIEPTATDCMLAMGWIDPSSFLGGRLTLQKDLALKAIKDNLCSPLNMSVEEAAAGAIHILTHSMTRACEINSIRRGFDVRDFALVAFGGAGPLFACAIANELSVSTIVIPPNPGLTSALGLLASDIVYEKSQTVMLVANKANVDKLKSAYNELESVLYSMLKADGFKKDEISLERAADCRYEGQGYELVTPYPKTNESSKINLSELLTKNFHAQHEKQYGKSFPEKNIQIVNIRARGRGATAQVKACNLKKMSITGKKAEPCSSAKAYFLSDGKLLYLETPRYSRKDLLPGHNILGPAIIDQMDSTTMVLPDWKAKIDQMGNIIISRGTEL